MAFQERLAPDAIRTKVRAACAAKKYFLTRTATEFMVHEGLDAVTVMNAIINHIDEDFKIHIKTFPNPTGPRNENHAYHANLEIDEDFFVYLEIKILNEDDPPIIRLNLHEHNNGALTLSR